MFSTKAIGQMIFLIKAGDPQADVMLTEMKKHRIDKKREAVEKKISYTHKKLDEDSFIAQYPVKLLSEDQEKKVILRKNDGEEISKT